MTEPDTLSLAVDQTLAATPETVFRALTEPDLYRQWMGPEGSTTTIEEMNVEEGGRFAMTVALPNGMSVDLSGTYLEVDPPNRLVHTWEAEGDENTTKVTISLNGFDAGTHLVLKHEGFADDADRSQNQGGWKHQLDRLSRLVDSLGG